MSLAPVTRLHHHLLTHAYCAVVIVTRSGTFTHHIQLLLAPPQRSEHMNTRRPYICHMWHGVTHVYTPAVPSPSRMPASMQSRNLHQLLFHVHLLHRGSLTVMQRSLWISSHLSCNSRLDRQDRSWSLPCPALQGRACAACRMLYGTASGTLPLAARPSLQPKPPKRYPCCRYCNCHGWHPICQRCI
jgi:hypothetical protein